MIAKCVCEWTRRAFLLRERARHALVLVLLSRPFLRLKEAFQNSTILTLMMADELNFLWSEIQNNIAEADADSISVPGQSESHGRCRCGVLLSPCVGALFVADQILGMEELELHCRCRGR